MTYKLKIKRKRVKKQKIRKEKVDWLKLPSDVMANILYRVGVIDILENAQKVCTAWRSICKEPAMWKVLCVENFWDPCERDPVREICKHAVDRSQGQLVDLTTLDVCNVDLLTHVVDRSPHLRCLEIQYCYGDLYDGWAESLKKFVPLEELIMQTTDISEEDIKTIGRYCPLLKTLKVNHEPHEFMYDDIALAIGKNLPELRNLQLIGGSMSNIGLQAILDGCKHLESLDLRQCFHVDLKGSLGKRLLKQIKDLKLPNDPLDKRSHGVIIEPKIHRQLYEEEEEDDDDDDDGDDDDFIKYNRLWDDDDDDDFTKYNGSWDGDLSIFYDHDELSSFEF